MKVISSIRALIASFWRALPSPVRLVSGLALLVLSGSGVLMLPWAGTGRPLMWNEAMFTAVSALTVTGLSIIAPGRDLTLFGQVALLALIQLGGTGFMVMATIILRLLRLDIRLDSRMALRDALGLNDLAQIITLTRNAVISVAVIELAGALLLLVHWRGLPLPAWEIAFYALFHAVSAMCNAGFDLFGGRPEFPAGMPIDNVTLTILGTLIFLGGIGIPVVSNVLSFPKTRKLTLHTRLALATSVALIAFGAAGIMIAESQPGGVLADQPLSRRAVMSIFQSVSARTAGFAGLPRFDQISHGSQFMLATLMFIGASPASMGGGIKTATFAVLVLSLISYVRGLPEATLRRRTVSKANIQKAAAVLVAGLFVVITATWLLLMTHPGATLDFVLFEVVSAFATCGLSIGFTMKLDVFGQLLIMAVMFWGRLGALTIVSAIAVPRRKVVVAYPEEPVLIG